VATINRKEAIAALEPLKPALPARDAIIEKTHLWFNGTHAFATDGGLGIKVKFTSPVKCGVPGSLFFGLLNQMAADTLEFEYEDNILKFKAGRSSIKLNTLPLDRGWSPPDADGKRPSGIWRYPDKPAGKALATITLTEDFIKGLKRVLSLKPVVKIRMEHHAVCVYAVNKEMDLYTTDSRSLLVTPISQALVGSVKKLAIPRPLAERIVGCAPGEDLKMYADHFTVAASDNVTLYSNILDTSEMLDIPGVADKFSDDDSSPPVPIPEGLTAALERAILLAGTDDPTVRLVTSGKTLKFSGHFKSGGVDEDFVLTKSAAKATIDIDAKTMLSVKDVKKLSIFDGRALNLRDDEGFMHMLVAKETPKPAKKGKGKGDAEPVPSEPDLADEDVPF
jgi:hypothetical protein